MLLTTHNFNHNHTRVPRMEDMLYSSPHSTAVVLFASFSWCVMAGAVPMLLVVFSFVCVFSFECATSVQERLSEFVAWQLVQPWRQCSESHPC
jgi:hypothetical protein